MNTKDTVKRVNLCPACGACPEVALDLKKDEVQIGEPGNQVTPVRAEWNALVEAILKGRLTTL